MGYQQLSFFTRPATAALRDRTRARNYSPGNEAFRREHERHRRWGLERRHAWKKCRLSGCSVECARVGIHDYGEPIPPMTWPEEATSPEWPERPDHPQQPD
jgi:hypothetical protein